MPRPLSLKKKLLFSLLVTTFATALMLAALEFFGYCMQPVLLRGTLEESFLFNHEWKPNSTFFHDEFVANNPDFPQPYTDVFNAQSWIETYDVAIEKPAGTYRIFYLGDSFTEGCAPMNQNVPGIVEAELNKLALEREKPMQFEVINTGTSSYSPLIFYVLLRHKVLKYSPDLVVIQVDMTDDFDDWKYGKTAIYDDAGNPWAAPPRNPYESAYFDSTKGVIKASFWTRTQLFLVRNSYFYNYLIQEKKKDASVDRSPSTELLDRENSEEIYNRWSWCKPEWDAYTKKNAGKTLETIGKIAELCRAHGVKVLLTSVPHYPQYASSYAGRWPPMWSNRPHVEIAKVARQHRVPYFDSYSALLPLVKGSPQEKYYYHRDMHLNPRGCAAWANAQLKYLLNPGSEMLPAAFYR